MSDFEDDIVLEDIKALQAVLVKNEFQSAASNVESTANRNAAPCEESASSSTSKDLCTLPNYQFVDVTNLRSYVEEENDETVVDVEDDTESESEYESDDSSNDKPSTVQALRLNAKLVRLLTVTKKKLTLLLMDCRKKQEEISKKKSMLSERCPMSRTILTTAGIPYFKDKKFFSAPKNEDVTIKAARGELQIVELPHCYRWLRKDRETLVKVIYWSARNEYEEQRRRDLTSEDGTEGGNADLAPLLFTKSKLSEKNMTSRMQQDLRQLVGPLGSKEFDWLKISIKDFNSRHSPTECRAMWNVFLHPDINKKKWQKNEDAKLGKLAEEYKFQNWEKIAEELNTGRTSYQCFVRCNSNRRNNKLNECTPWTPEEDQKLIDTINKTKMGDFVPWGQVAVNMGSRTKQQVYLRYNYSLSPQLKKGRFSKEEDKLLLDAVAKYGNNFSKISTHVFPSRSSVQLNDHYKTLTTRTPDKWTLKDDEKLLALYEKYGNHWSEIAKEFSNKNRIHVRHRYSAILRYLERGLSLFHIPRHESSNKVMHEYTAMESKRRLNAMARSMIPSEGGASKKQISPVDKELRDYFRAIYQTPAKLGRTKKFYTPEELAMKTQKLDAVLNILKANLNIPDNFEDDKRSLDLTEKDKQLLKSLKKFIDFQQLRRDTQDQIVEATGLKMFGPVSPNDGGHFIPPLPFSATLIRAMKNPSGKINYECKDDKFIVKPDEELANSSEEIVSLIGGPDREIQYQQMKKIFLRTTRISTSKQLANVRRTLPGRSVQRFNHRIISNKGKIEHMSNNKSGSSRTPNQSLCVSNKETASCLLDIVMPPNFETLLGFRGILLAKHMLESSDNEDEELKAAEETTDIGEQASDLFVERLIKLFRLPIELSEIRPPVEYDMECEDMNDKPLKRKFSKSTEDSECTKMPKIAEEPVSDASEAGPSWA